MQNTIPKGADHRGKLSRFVDELPLTRWKEPDVVQLLKRILELIRRRQCDSQMVSELRSGSTPRPFSDVEPNRDRSANDLIPAPPLFG